MSIPRSYLREAALAERHSQSLCAAISRVRAGRRARQARARPNLTRFSARDLVTRGRRKHPTDLPVLPFAQLDEQMRLSRRRLPHRHRRAPARDSVSAVHPSAHGHGVEPAESRWPGSVSQLASCVSDVSSSRPGRREIEPADGNEPVLRPRQACRTRSAGPSGSRRVVITPRGLCSRTVRQDDRRTALRVDFDAGAFPASPTRRRCGRLGRRRGRVRRGWRRSPAPSTARQASRARPIDSGTWRWRGCVASSSYAQDCVAARSIFSSAARGGCFQSSTVIHVKADGSGTIDQRTLLTEAAVDQLRTFAILGGGNADSVDPISEAQARALAATIGSGRHLRVVDAASPSAARTGATRSTRSPTSRSCASASSRACPAASSCRRSGGDTPPIAFTLTARRTATSCCASSSLGRRIFPTGTERRTSAADRSNRSRW